VASGDTINSTASSNSLIKRNYLQGNRLAGAGL